MTNLANVLTAWLPILTPVVGAAWAFWLYLKHQRETNAANAQSAEREARTRRIESRKPFLELQLKLYIEIGDVVGRLISEPVGTPPYQAADKQFWALYWSRLCMVESEKVETVMAKMGEAVSKVLATGDEKEKAAVKRLSLDLAHLIRSEIETAWGGEPERKFVVDGNKTLYAIHSA